MKPIIDYSESLIPVEVRGAFDDTIVPLAESSPTDTVEYMRTLHAGLGPIDRRKIDHLLFGASCTELDRELTVASPRELAAKYAGEMPWAGTQEAIWTPYEVSRMVVSKLTELGMSSDDVLYDLGSGYGRVVLYAGMTATAQCKGVELLPERVEVATAARNRLQLDNVDFTAANVRDVDFSDGTIFYFWHPFSAPTFRNVIERLRMLAEQRLQAGDDPITIVSRGKAGLMDVQPWLIERAMPMIEYPDNNEFFSRLDVCVIHQSTTAADAYAQ